MGVADRDYMREPPPRERTLSGWTVAILLGVAAVLGLSLYWTRGDGSHITGVVYRPLGLSNTPGITLASGARQSPYVTNDPWASWLAPESVCPGGDDASASPAVQIDVATCLLNYARTRQGLPALPRSAVLDLGALRKAQDILACSDFSHFACGKAPDSDARSVGLTDRAFGENIYWGPQVYEPPRVAVDQWLNSDHHRENLFDPQWRAQGVAVIQATFQGSRGEMWINEFSAP